MDQEVPSTFLKGQGSQRIYWDFLIIVLASYQAVMIPLEIAYQFDVFNNPISITGNSLMDIVFITDILINFRTTYIDPTGEEVIEWHTIAY